MESFMAMEPSGRDEKRTNEQADNSEARKYS